MTREEITEKYPDSELLFADGFDAAIVGVCQKFNALSVLYDLTGCIEILVERDGMSEEEAREYLEFNTLGAWVGEHTPTFILPYDD